MKILPILEANRTDTGRIPSFKAISPCLDTGTRKSLGKLCKRYPIRIAAYVLDNGYPKCLVCKKLVTTRSTNNRGDIFSPFNLTCSLDCAGKYRVSNENNSWVCRRTYTFNKVSAALKKRKDFQLLSKLADSGFTVKCLKCGKIKQASPSSIVSGSLSCRCVAGEKISEARRIPQEVYEEQANLKKRRLKLISPYSRMHIHIKVKCLVCNNIWRVLPNNLMRAGCPECAPDKMRFNSLCKHGVEYSTQRPEVKAKIRATMKERYGVEHALQNKEILEKNLKSAYTFKPYLLGKRKVKVQGYEPQALDYIIRTKKVKPKDIRCGFESEMPTIKYQWNGKDRTYHPDIFVVSQNRIIEVKSSYTASVAKSLAAKRLACKEQGYKFTLLIMGEKGERINEC